MPIGSDAVYVHAHIEPATGAGMTVDEDYIVMTPDEQLVDIYENRAGWDRQKDRCKKRRWYFIFSTDPGFFYR